MRAREFLPLLVEGVGLARRKPGEVFKNQQGETLVFQGLEFFPNVGKYPTPADMDTAKTQATNGKNITWVNAPGNNLLAFGLASFKDNKNADVVLGKYFKDIKANRNDNDFPHSAIPGGYKYNTKEGIKENAGYKPSEVLTNFDGQTPQSIVDQIVSKFGQGSDEAVAAQTFLAASNFPVKVPKGAMNFEAFKIYFCEMLQPIALVKGMKLSGNAQDAVNMFFGPGASLTNCSIKFNDNQGGALSDSVLVTPDGKELKISTKDAVGGGAKASAQNFLRIIDELEQTDKGRLIIKKHQNVMQIINAFKGNEKKNKPGEFDGKTHFSAPLDIAVQTKLITPEEKEQVMNLKNMNLDLGDTPIGKNIISAKLEEWYNNYLKNWKKPVVPIHTMMLIIAFKVTKHVNENTNFSASASDILNNSALIQVYNDVIPSDKDFLIRGMHAVYPSQAVTGVKLTTEKAYWTTGAQGNMTFHILYNGESGGVSSSDAPAPETSALAQKSVPAPQATPAQQPVTPLPVQQEPAPVPASIQNQTKQIGAKIPMGQEPITPQGV